MPMHSSSRRGSTPAPGVYAALAAAIMAGAGLAGCRSRYTPPLWLQQGATPTLSIKNDATSAARVTVLEGRRDPARPGAVLQPGLSKPLTLRPGATQVWSIESKVPSAERVVRFKVETIGASWEEPVVTWFEVVGPMPAKVISLERPQNGVFAIRTFDGDVRFVPREYWAPAADAEDRQDPAPGGG